GIYNKVIYVDSFAWLDTLSTNYQSQGFTVASGGTACNITLMAQNATAYATKNPSVLAPGQSAVAYGQNFASSLFCAPGIYTVSGADQTYVFADQVHPSTHGHALFAQYVEQQIAASGLGK
ncbi:MAG: acylhydrolase, partial [Paraburkholderia sp.]|nr:acylhydrolase [Paraburkholderia sp.]